MKIKKGLFGWGLDTSIDELRDFRTLDAAIVFPLMKFLDKTLGFDFVGTAFKIYREDKKK